MGEIIKFEPEQREEKINHYLEVSGLGNKLHAMGLSIDEFDIQLYPNGESAALYPKSETARHFLEEHGLIMPSK